MSVQHTRGVQYTGGCSAHWGYIMSTVGISWVHWGVFSTLENIMSITGEYHDKCGEGHWKTIESVWKPQCTENPLVYLRYPPHLSWYPLTLIMVSPIAQNTPGCTHDIPQCTHDIPTMYSWYPPLYWTPPSVLMKFSQCTEHPLVYSMISPHCTHDIPTMYSWCPPLYWTSPSVLHTPRRMYLCFKPICSHSFLRNCFIAAIHLRNQSIENPTSSSSSY